MKLNCIEVVKRIDSFGPVYDVYIHGELDRTVTITKLTEFLDSWVPVVAVPRGDTSEA